MSDSLVFRLGPFRVILDRPPLDLGADRSGLVHFVVDEPADVRLDLSVGDAPRSSWPESHVESWEVDPQRGVIEMATTEWHAVFDVDGACVQAELKGAWTAALDSLLKTMLQVFVLSLGYGVVMHSAAVVRDQAGVCFAGRSGSGKTTAAFSARDGGADVLCEEMCVVDLTRSEPYVCRLPFPERTLVSQGPLEAPLRRVYALGHADRDQVCPMSHAQCVQHVASAVSIGVRDPFMMELALPLVAKLVERVPVKLLDFHPSSELWSVIAQDLQGES